jgi:hypothetical protein
MKAARQAKREGRAKATPLHRPGGERGAEFAGGEGIEGAKAAGEFTGAEAALAVEPAKKVQGVAFAFPRVAFQAAGDQVAVGVAPEPGLRDDVIDGAHAPVGLPQAIKAAAVLTRVDGLAQRPRFEKIQLFGVDGKRLGSGFAGLGRIRPDGRNLFRQTHLDQMAGLAAFEHAQGAMVHKAAHGRAHGFSTKASAAGEPGDGKAEPKLSLEAAVAYEMIVDDAFRDGETEPRDEQILDLFPHQCRIDFLVFHVFSFS